MTVTLIKSDKGESLCYSGIHSLTHSLVSPPPMDDDIQFLGMVNTTSPQRQYVHPSHPPLRPPASGASTNQTHTDPTITRRGLTFPLIGIMLVIPKAGDEPTQTLRFLKSRSTVVHIGRASSSLGGDADKSPDAIQFRCPVISRKHAKLMFSSGHVSPINFCATLLTLILMAVMAYPYMHRSTSSTFTPIMVPIYSEGTK